MPALDLSSDTLDELFKKLGSNDAAEREAAERELKRRLCVENRRVSGDEVRPVKEAVKLAHDVASKLVEGDTEADQKDKDHERQLHRILTAGCCTFTISVLNVKPEHLKDLDQPIKFIFGPASKKTSASRELRVANGQEKKFEPPLLFYNSVQQGDIYACGDTTAEFKIYLEAEGRGSGTSIIFPFICTEANARTSELPFQSTLRGIVTVQADLLIERVEPPSPGLFGAPPFGKKPSGFVREFLFTFEIKCKCAEV
jgi:hypothetical protein